MPDVYGRPDAYDVMQQRANVGSTQAATQNVLLQNRIGSMQLENALKGTNMLKQMFTGEQQDPMQMLQQAYASGNVNVYDPVQQYLNMQAGIAGIPLSQRKAEAEIYNLYSQGNKSPTAGMTPAFVQASMGQLGRLPQNQEEYKQINEYLETKEIGTAVEKRRQELLLDRLPPERAKMIAKAIVSGQESFDQIPGKFNPSAAAQIQEEIFKLDPNFNAVESSQKFAWYKNPNTYRALTRTDTLLRPGGTLDQYEKALKGLNYPPGMTINQLTGRAQREFGSRARVVAETIAALTAEELQQIFGSAQGGEAFLKLGQEVTNVNLPIGAALAQARTLRRMIIPRLAAQSEGTPYMAKVKKYIDAEEKSMPPLKALTKEQFRAMSKEEQGRYLGK